MKIKSLHIDAYRHLQDIHFDFTYPEGHENAGKPLNKICIIGQSATGKTSVLELIRNSVSKLESVEVTDGQCIWNHFHLDFSGQLEFLQNHVIIKLTNSVIIKNGQEFQNTPNGGGSSMGKLMTDGVKLVYLSAELISTNAINILNLNPVSILYEFSAERYSGLQKNFNRANYIYKFGQEVNEEIWFSLLYKILDYRKRFTQMASELINKGAISDLAKLNKEYLNWSKTNEHPLILFANYFNPILNKLHLEVDLINTEYAIPIKSGNKEEVIPIKSLSTGTKGLLLSMFPLFELDTTDSMILLDEPERSLFPDMQIDLMSHYQRLAPEAQFIVATHSPFIVAAFEPEERFILYFNEKGEVAVRRGESPIGDDPNDMLRNDFKVDYYNDFGKRAYQEYLDLKRKAAQETELEKKKKLIVELAELGDKYNF